MKYIEHKTEHKNIFNEKICVQSYFCVHFFDKKLEKSEHKIFPCFLKNEQ